MVDHYIEAHFEVKAETVIADRDRRIQERAIALLTKILREKLTYRDKFDAEKYARVLVLGVSALPQVLRQAIDEIDK